MSRFLLICSILLVFGLVMTGASNQQLLLGDVKGEKYLKVSPSRVESVGIESVFFYDITRDGVPEVWLITDDCEADKLLLVYSMSDWGKELLRRGAGHMSLYGGKGYVLEVIAHMGIATWYQLSWNGKRIVVRKTYEENLHGETNYRLPREEPLMLWDSLDRYFHYLF